MQRVCNACGRHCEGRASPVAPRTIVLFVAVALGAVVLLAAVHALRTIVIQLILAIVLAMAAELVRFFVRRGAPRGRAVGISFALIAIVLSAFGYLLVRPLVDESTRFVHDAPALVQHLSRGNGRLGFLETRFTSSSTRATPSTRAT